MASHLERLRSFLEEVNRLALVSGYEEHHLPLFVELVESYVGREVKVVDRNVVIEGESDVAVSAHYDEIGYVVDNAYRGDLYRTIPVGLNSWERGYGKVLRTLLEGEEVVGIGTAPMPHVEGEEERLFIELLEERFLPPLWPFTFSQEVVVGKGKLFSRALDDRVGVFIALEMAKKGYSVVLWAGEELGTTRVVRVVDSFKAFLEVDTIFSAGDVHAPYGVEDGSVAYIAVEGGGKGNRAPKEMVEAVKDIAVPFKTTSPYEVTDATAIYRFGGKALALLVPIYYLHSSLEMVKAESVERGLEVVERVMERLVGLGKGF